MSNKYISILGVLSFVLSLGASVYFYQERTVFLDISFHLFYILKDQAFAIQNYRFAAFFTQMFPMLGDFLGLPLSSIAILYSTSFVILPAIAFGVIVGVYKNYKIGAAYLIYLLLMVTHTFFWIQSELPQGMAFVFLFLATLEYWYDAVNSAKVGVGILILLLLVVIVFSHPLVIFPMGFAAGFYWLTYKDKKWKTVVIFSFFILIYGVKSIWFKTSYDSGALDTISNYSFSWSEFVHLYSFKKFAQYVVSDYYLWIASLLGLVLYYTLQNDFLKLLLVLLFNVLLVSIIGITYPNGAEQFYLENQYQLLAFFVSLPIVNVLFEKNCKQWLFVFLLVIQVAFLFRMWMVSTVYQSRLNMYKDILSTTAHDQNKKIIYSINDFPKDTLLMDWASSYEFWLLSTMETGQTRSVIIAYQENEFDYALSNNHCVITKWGAHDYSEFHSPYFVFADTSKYVKKKNRM
ncbi:MAG: hypothetical protein U0U66_10270 [Cytophagaceae bacterium]